MNYFFALLIPFIFLLSFSYALCKKVKLYDSFAEGVKGAIPLVTSIFPYIATVTILSCLLEVSGLERLLIRLCSPFFNVFGIPEEIMPLLFIKPLSGSGSIAVLSDILATYGVDSYIGRCACVAYGSSETVFYIGAVYFASVKQKKLPLAVFIALLANFLSTILCCFLCKFM